MAGTGLRHTKHIHHQLGASILPHHLTNNKHFKQQDEIPDQSKIGNFTTLTIWDPDITKDGNDVLVSRDWKWWLEEKIIC